MAGAGDGTGVAGRVPRFGALRALVFVFALAAAFARRFACFAAMAGAASGGRCQTRAPK